MEAQLSQLQPGRKRRQLESAIEHTQRDVLALRRQYSQPLSKRHGHGVRLKQHSLQLKIMPPRKTTTAHSRPDLDKSHERDHAQTL
eukprot:3751252-Rhodomonas_salina.1